MSNILKTEDYINNYIIDIDPMFKKLIDICNPIEIGLSGDYFASLASSIIGQQLSNKVADVIWARLGALMNGDLSPQKISAIGIEELRKIGVSYSKIGYLKNLSEALINKKIRLNDFESMENEEIINKLVEVKGIGNWTAEMFLIFSLGREDVFSLGDGGLQRSIKWLYQFEELPQKRQLMKISEKWKPYRTYASLYLWEAIDKNLIVNKGVRDYGKVG
ncbi:MAG: DNA-3-methyladenine glycosylase [Clostridia bacterium]